MVESEAVHSVKGIGIGSDEVALFFALMRVEGLKNFDSIPSEVREDTIIVACLQI